MATKMSKIVLFSSKSKKHTIEKTKRSVKKKVLILAVIAALLAGMYCTAMFSDIPIIKKWRDLYIETAMDTYTHKWLATFFIPKSVIDGVLANKEAIIEEQQDLKSSWEPVATTAVLAVPDNTLKNFLRLFNELDATSFNDYITKNLNLINNGYDKLLINEAGLGADGTPIYTTNGDQVLAIDAENGILIVKVTGDGYVGKLAIVKYAAQVKIGVSQHLGSWGQTVPQIAEDNNAVLAINASGFADPEWKGNGGLVVGLLISNGAQLHDPVKNGYLNIGFADDNRLYIGLPVKQAEYRDAVEFIPALIINGENVTDGSTGFGIQPRTAIGQTEDGTVLMLTIDGRQIGYSLGTTVGVCADIMQKYGAEQASNLDGGSSTIMVYRGEVITKPSGSSDYGRYVPDAFIVEYAGITENGD